MSSELELDYAMSSESYSVEQTYCEARNYTSWAHEHWFNSFQEDGACSHKRGDLILEYHGTQHQPIVNSAWKLGR